MEVGYSQLFKLESGMQIMEPKDEYNSWEDYKLFDSSQQIFYIRINLKILDRSYVPRITLHFSGANLLLCPTIVPSIGLGPQEE